MPVLMLPGTGAVTQWYGEYPTGGPVYADPAKEAIRRDLIRLYGNYQPAGHDGVDIAANMNDPVVAPGDGILIWSGWESQLPLAHAARIGLPGGMPNSPAGGPGGLVVYIDLGGGLYTYMAHLNETLVDHRVGSFISRGTLVGRAGTTGRSGGVHIHWSVVNTNNITGYAPYGRIDPMQYVTASRPLLIGAPDPVSGIYADE